MPKKHGPYSNNLYDLRKMHGLTQHEVAQAVNSARAHISKLEAGKIGMTEDWIRRLGSKFGWTPCQLLGQHGVPVLGKVGGGGEVYPHDELPLIPRFIGKDEQDLINCEWVDAPPGIYPSGVVALRVEGSSMMPFMPEGTIVYYAERFDGGAPDHCISTLCVVQLRDGKTLLKMVRKGHSHGKFDLVSYNMETISDVELAWCAPVVFVKPYLRR